MTNYLQMTQKELDINTVMDWLLKKEIWIKEASKRINRCVKQTRRIRDRYLKEWSKWLIHKARGKASNNTWNTAQYTPALAIIKENYYDYGPTLASEKLAEKHHIIIPVSTLRLAMINVWIWKGKKRKAETKHFTARERRESYGEMVQYDGSYHLWFEWRDNTKYQCLLVAVDDATGEVTAKFAKNEWLFETMEFWKDYLLQKWKPRSIYLDKFATYKVNYPNATDDKELPTQFNRACKKLWFANSPQAKGRVERMNSTLQDRLVKALREEGISDIITANIFLKETFLPYLNKKFMVEPRNDSNIHLTLRTDEVEILPQVFSKHIPRKVANDFTIKIDNVFYQLYRRKNGGYTLKSWETVIVEKHGDGSIHISKYGTYIDHKISFERPLRKSKPLTAPISDAQLIEMKQTMIEEQREKKKENEKKRQESEKTDTYYEKYWKTHPYVANCFNS